jgi:hypothetical protein
MNGERNLKSERLSATGIFLDSGREGDLSGLISNIPTELSA